MTTLDLVQIDLGTAVSEAAWFEPLEDSTAREGEQREQVRRERLLKLVGLVSDEDGLDWGTLARVDSEGWGQETTDAAPYDGRVFIADKSAWCRFRDPAINAAATAAILNDQIATCAICKLEILFSARTRTQFDEWAEALSALRDVPITRSTCASALAGMTQLASRSDGSHRLGIPDYLIAAAAEDAGIGVLHYDHHYERLAEVFSFESRWIAKPGSIS